MFNPRTLEKHQQDGSEAAGRHPACPTGATGSTFLVGVSPPNPPMFISDSWPLAHHPPQTLH